MDKTNKQILSGIVIIVVAAWLSWISICAVSYDKRIGIVEAAIIYVKDDLHELKALIKEVRNDQIRRQQKDK